LGKTENMQTVENQHGQPIERVLADLYAKHRNLRGVGRELGLDHTTVRDWIHRLDGKIVKELAFPTETELRA